MSDKPISVGDLVYVKRGCCTGKYDGYVGIVSLRYTSNGPCWLCGTNYSGVESAELVGVHAGFALSWLKRIPPLDELESEKRDEEITA